MKVKLTHIFMMMEYQNYISPSVMLTDSLFKIGKNYYPDDDYDDDDELFLWYG